MFIRRDTGTQLPLTSEHRLVLTVDRSGVEAIQRRFWTCEPVELVVPGIPGPLICRLILSWAVMSNSSGFWLFQGEITPDSIVQDLCAQSRIQLIRVSFTTGYADIIPTELVSVS